MSKQKLGLGIVIGSVVGVIAGLLTAPKSGKETREDIKKRAQEVKGSLERKLKDAHKELGTLSEELKEKAKTVQGKAKEELNELAKKADELKERTKAAITSIKSGDDEDDEATLDQLVKDFMALKTKVVTKLKS